MASPHACATPGCKNTTRDRLCWDCAPEFPAWQYACSNIATDPEAGIMWHYRNCTTCRTIATNRLADQRSDKHAVALAKLFEPVIQLEAST